MIHTHNGRDDDDDDAVADGGLVYLEYMPSLAPFTHSILNVQHRKTQKTHIQRWRENKIHKSADIILNEDMIHKKSQLFSVKFWLICAYKDSRFLRHVHVRLWTHGQCYVP